MKKICIVFLGLAIIILSAAGLALSENNTRTEYLRIHIRANSNDYIDQSVKYKVKQAVVEYLTPFIAECKTFSDAENLLTDNLDGIEEVADRVLEENGFSYTSDAGVKNERFPTRKYGGLVLESGFYDALIINLGSGSGDNWWCVVYPPLCFTEGNGNYVYKSKISEIINDFLNREKQEEK